MSKRAWQDFLLLSAFVLLFGAAMTATVENRQMPHIVIRPAILTP